MADNHIIKVFIVEDDDVFANILKLFLEEIPNVGFEIHRFATGKECIQNIKLDPHLVILDLNLPDLSGLELLKQFKKDNGSFKTIVLSGQQKIEIAIEVYRTGVDYYILKSGSCWDELKNAIDKLTNHICLQKEVERLKEEIIDRNKYSNILGNSHAMLRVLKLVQRIEKSNITVLITGESGTGKELIARTLHYNSPRKNRSFIPINVPAIPEDLIESELFGHEKGAFTGAVKKRIGKFEEADKGTIFLDEVGEMNLDLQSKLLRVLQENEVVRIGGNKVMHVDVKIIASTNKDIAHEVKNGRFREDLFYRLNGIQIKLPTLKERDDDIILLAKHFLKEFCKSNNLPDIKFDKEAFESLMKCSWPGNVRELKSVIERSALLTNSSIIRKEDLIFTDTNTTPSDFIITA